MKKILIASLVFGGAMVLGCDDKSTTPAPATPGAPTMEKATEQATDATKAATDKTAGAADATKTAGADATKATSDAAAASMEEVTKTLGGTPPEMYDKAMAFLKENKLADAEGILVKLESVKPKLPAEWASKVDSLRSTYESAKKGAAALPAVPGMGK